MSMDVIRMQPRPVLTQMCHLRTRAGQVVTAIARHWEPGDTGRCRLCPDCCANADVCLVMIGHRVSEEDAPTASMHGLKLQEV